jgi:hypothetical protein
MVNITNLTEKEIYSSMVLFAKQFNVDITSNQMNTFMNRIHQKRKINVNKDAFLQICEFMSMADIISLIVTCKEYCVYEKYVWGIIQIRYFPNSIIPNTDYKNIKINMSLDYYYFLKNCVTPKEEKSIEEKSIEEDEEYMLKRYDEFNCINENSVHRSIRIGTINGELRALRETRLISLNELNEGHKNRLIDMLHCSIVDQSGVPYYTIKQEMDIAIYGLDETNPRERKIGIEYNKWVTGEYNEDQEFDYDSDTEVRISNTPIFEYYNNRIDGRCRVRIKPNYIKKLEKNIKYNKYDSDEYDLYENDSDEDEPDEDEPDEDNPNEDNPNEDEPNGNH